MTDRTTLTIFNRFWSLHGWQLAEDRLYVMLFINYSWVYIIEGIPEALQLVYQAWESCWQSASCQINTCLWKSNMYTLSMGTSQPHKAFYEVSRFRQLHNCICMASGMLIQCWHQCRKLVNAGHLKHQVNWCSALHQLTTKDMHMSCSLVPNSLQGLMCDCEMSYRCNSTHLADAHIPEIPVSCWMPADVHACVSI